MTHINGEPVELVTSFESLRAGDIVYLSPCGFCGSTERMMLTALLRNAPGRYVDGEHGQEDAWLYQPPAACDRALPGAVARGSVEIGIVYRVINPLEAPAESTHERRPEVVR